jgi:maltooligosyltrehalose synthase
LPAFPVYRTYVEPGQPVSEEDQQIVERAIAAAKRRNPAMEESIFNFLRDVLLLRSPQHLDAAGPRRACAVCSEISADHQASYGEGTRRHAFLHLQPAAGVK